MKRKYKKQKFERCCYNCKYRWQKCKDRFKVSVCDNFQFDAVSKST